MQQIVSQQFIFIENILDADKKSSSKLTDSKYNMKLFAAFPESPAIARSASAVVYIWLPVSLECFLVLYLQNIKHLKKYLTFLINFPGALKTNAKRLHKNVCINSHGLTCCWNHCGIFSLLFFFNFKIFNSNLLLYYNNNSKYYYYYLADHATNHNNVMVNECCFCETRSLPRKNWEIKRIWDVAIFYRCL